MKKMPIGSKQPKEKKVKFNDREIQTLVLILQGTWQYIGHDIMNSLAEDGRYDIPQADLVEVVLDADYAGKMVTELKANELWGRFCAMSYEDRIAFAKKNAFPYKRYS